MGQARIRIASIIAVLVIVVGGTGCSTVPGAGAAVLQSDKPRAAADAASLPQLVAGNTQFALDLYKALYRDTNLFVSPYSISTALAMTYAGARGDTATEMAQALHFVLPQESLHAALNALQQALAARGASTTEQGEKFQLNVANALWGQKAYTFLPAFLDTLAANYGAGMRTVDFAKAAEEARKTINRWVEEQTQSKIKDLLPPGSVDVATRLVLTNAIYFKSRWAYPFPETATKDAPFALSDGTSVSVPTMRQAETFGYAAGNGYQAVELLYAGREVSMVILLPERGTLESFVRGLDADSLAATLGSLKPQPIELQMPRWSFEYETQLSDVLSAMGMRLAFTSDADLSGMTGKPDLYIDRVYHKAFVAVDEKGTEAAAATAVMVELSAAPMSPKTVSVDHPFVFLIRDITTGSILFMGQVVNPK